MPKTPAEDWADSPWMPPSPHKEAVLERLAKGRCHIEAQGHGKPPLLVHEDGGILELPQARVGSWDLYADETASPPPGGLTKHVDVCGTIDEIEAWLKEDPGGALTDPERLQRLLHHALAMCGRMQRRRQAYRAFAAAVAELAEVLRDLAGPDCSRLDEDARAAGLRAAEADYEGLVCHAEAIRDVANALEQTLRKYRDASTQLAALYEDIRGARDWGDDVRDRLAALRAPKDTPAPSEL
jgi:hypothetical protein